MSGNSQCTNEDIQNKNNITDENKIDIKTSDFYFGITLGEGSYARVVHAKHKRTSEEFAIKIMEKIHIKKENKIKAVMRERQILSMVSHPFIVKFFFSFQDAGYLYLCMDLAPGGELLSLITIKLMEKTEQGIENEACDYRITKFYMAELIEGMEYLHNKQIVHRDIKPENILLNRLGHIKITDFGTSAFVDSDSPRTSFVGTPDYVSPEVLTGESKATKACDIWAIGCILYQMLTGISPFRASTEYLTFEAIMGHCKGTSPLIFPDVINEITKDLIMKILQPIDTERLGAGYDIDHTSYKYLKEHLFFNGIEWGTLDCNIAPYLPNPLNFPSTDNMRDGSTDDWLLEGEATPIISKSKVRAITGLSTKSIRSTSIYQNYLHPDEFEVFQSTIYKRVGLFSKKRQLILTTTPRLIYVDPSSMELKGEIPWTKEFPVSVVIKNQKEFDIICSMSGRAYHLSDSIVGSTKWEEMINQVIDECHNSINTTTEESEHIEIENDSDNEEVYTMKLS